MRHVNVLYVQWNEWKLNDASYRVPSFHLFSTVHVNFDTPRVKYLKNHNSALLYISDLVQKGKALPLFFEIQEKLKLGGH